MQANALRHFLEASPNHMHVELVSPTKDPTIAHQFFTLDYPAVTDHFTSGIRRLDKFTYYIPNSAIRKVSR